MKKIEYVNGVECYFLDERKVSFEEFTALSLDELKAKKIAELKANRDIYKKANGYDNLNIVDNILIGLGNYTDEERLSCKIFFNNLIIKYDTIKNLINNSNLETINSISITFEE